MRAREPCVSFERADIELLVEKLRRIYEEKRRYVQATLDGRILVKPAPIMELFGRVIRGIPVDDSRLRVLEPKPHLKLVIAVDASAKVLFNLGTSRIIVSKVVVLAYRGLRRVKSIRMKRLGLVESKAQAGEWLLRVEYEAALRALRELSGKGYLLMDRGLLAPPILRPSTRELINRVRRRALAEGIITIGVPKITKLSLDTGESVLSYLTKLAEKRLRGMAWYYYPLFKLESLPPWVFGAPAIARLSEYSEKVLRIDVARKALMRLDCEEILEELSFLQDPTTPGYPYPLRAVHEESRISDNEAELDRLILLEELGGEGLREKLLVNVKSVSYREKALWGEIP
ncbi:MAG: hypothetical protein DRK00_02280 [Thermoprotei archaeon]|nr:MAG: hypothetical protein DRK00_02280 [Thermoprotei archaeon]